MLSDRNEGLERENTMKLPRFHDPRSQQTFDLITLAIFSNWIGQYVGDPTHTTLSWWMFVLIAVGAVGSFLRLLLSVWKPEALNHSQRI